MKIYKTRCFYCGDRLTDKTKSRDHVVAKVCGGTFGNFVACCRPCNNMKADLTIEEFRVVFFGAHIKPFYGEQVSAGPA